MSRTCTPTFGFLLPGRSRRAGVSLLEVLISIFVLSIGLLGVAAILPVGHYEIMQGSIADRSAACGQAGLHEVKARRMVNPLSWLKINPTTGGLDYVVPSVGPQILPFQDSYAIDPWYIARNGAVGGGYDTDVERFPYNPSGRSMVRVAPDWMGVPGVPLTQANLNAQRALFRRVFAWEDVLQIPVPEEDGQRPRQVMFCDSDDGPVSAAYPWRPEDLSPTGLLPLARETLDDYTWLVTVTPVVDVGDDTSVPPDGVRDRFFFLDRHRVYDVSVVVFYKRDFSEPGVTLVDEPPGERMVAVTLLGGGDVLLTVPATGLANYLDLKEGHWLMLCGSRQVTVPNNILPKDVFKWYEIVAASDIEIDPATSTAQRYVTLAGPDWESDISNTQAALFSRVVGVYTTTVNLDGW